jgi:hypothetical protein
VKYLFFILFVIAANTGFSQKIDSIYFHLYTDSLKKGQNNYINIDGKMSDGKWLPLSAKEIEFSCPTAQFQGNDLIIPFDFKEQKVKVKAVLRSNPSVFIERTIWIKQRPDPPLPSGDGIRGTPNRRSRY